MTTQKAKRITRAPTMKQTLDRSPFPTLEHLLAKVAEDFVPNERLTVTESAMKYTKIGDGGGRTVNWSLRKTPYIAEPQDILTSLDHTGMIFVGPARTGKSVMVLTWTTHTVMNDPDDMLVVHTDMKNGRKWSKGEFDRFLIASKDIRARQMTARQFDNTFDKQFKSGMRFNLTFPTASNLSAITVGKVFFMDYDRIPDDATESSNPYDLGSVRTRTKGRRGMCAAESSPNPDKEMEDPKWRPSNQHEAPPSTGIFELYNRGDRRLFMWRCIHDDCKQWFEGTFDLLKGWQEHDEISEAAEAVYLECPCCGKAIQPSMRDHLNLHGRWVPQGAQIDPEGNLIPIPGMKMRRSKIASFWLKGPAAGYFTWNELVASYLTATRAYEATQDEGPLRKWTTTDYGSYYISKARLSDRNPEDLREKAEDWGSTREVPTIPPGVRFFVITVDVQGDGFVCQTTGFMPNGDMVVIDGFKITSSDRLDADGKNLPVDPRAFPDDWDMLYDQVYKRTYELSDGSGRRMRARMCSVDGYGQEGVTTQAYRFWLRLRELGDGSHRRFAITKGEPNANWPIAKTSITEAGANNKHALVRGAIPRIHVGSLIAKDAVAGFMAQRVQSENNGVGGMLRYPSWMPMWFYKQLTNEIREAKAWKKIGSRRNEAFDLTSYALALVMRPVEIDSPFDNIQFHRIGWDDETNCPIWAAEWDKNDHVFTPVYGDDPTPEPAKPKRLSLAELAKKLA